jgi:glycine oxidase
VSDVLVLGGGIVGLACARELALHGLRVELLERGRPGGGASTAAAGMLAPLAEAGGAGPFLDAARAARDLWPRWLEEVTAESGMAVEHAADGTLLVALADEDPSALAAVERTAREAGEPVERLTPAAARLLVPDLTSAVAAALHLGGEQRVDAVQACAALRVAAERCGARLSFGHEARRVERRGGGVRVSGDGWQRDAERLVLAAGAWSGAIDGLPPLPVRPVRGQIVRLDGVGWEWRGAVRCESGYAVRRGQGGLLVGTTVEEAGFVASTTVDGVAGLLAFARRLFPALGGAAVGAAWAGLRPATPDGHPLIGPLPSWPVLAATGHFRNGILLAPWTAREIARWIVAPERAGAPLFDPARI